MKVSSMSPEGVDGRAYVLVIMSIYAKRVKQAHGESDVFIVRHCMCVCACLGSSTCPALRRQMAEVAFVRACSYIERARAFRGGVRVSPLAVWEVAFVRARSHSERLNSTVLRPRETARVLGAGAAFVRARSHSGRRGQTLVFFQCTPVYVPVYASVRSSVRPSVRWAFYVNLHNNCTCGH